jgi:urease accessory protein UreE
MSLLEKKIIDKIEILENSKIQVREAMVIEKDGQEIARTFHRHVLSPGDDLSSEDPRVSAVANAIWTEEVISQFLDSITEIE